MLTVANETILRSLSSTDTPSDRSSNWRPIVSAPMNQTPILIYCPTMPEHDRQFVASWQSNLGADESRTIQDEWCEIVTGLPGLDDPHRPTHFTMLPIPGFEFNLSKLRLLGWLPIELAPRDGTPMLVYDPSLPSSHRVFAARWEDTEEGSRGEAVEWCEVVTGLAGIDLPFRPTHFMPLPTAPS